MVSARAWCIAVTILFHLYQSVFFSPPEKLTNNHSSFTAIFIIIILKFVLVFR